MAHEQYDKKDDDQSEHGGHANRNDAKIGEDIPYADNIPPTLISDDSKNDINEQDHHGSDNAPNGGRAK